MLSFLLSSLVGDQMNLSTLSMINNIGSKQNLIGTTNSISGSVRGISDDELQFVVDIFHQKCRAPRP